MAAHDSPVVKFKRPVDFEILEAYSDGRRDLGANIAERLGRDRGYINTRLPQLEDYDLLSRVGPIENSGLYVITPKGVAALKLRGRYEEPDFDQQVEDRSKQIDVIPPRVVDEGSGND